MKLRALPLLLFCDPVAASSACQPLDWSSASGNAQQGTNLLDPNQCITGSPQCFALCGAPSCALPDSAIPPELATPVIYNADGSTTANACDAVEQESMVILQRSCAPCHELPQQLGGFDYVLDDAKLTTSTSASYKNNAGMLWPMVAAGEPSQSWIYERIVNGQMPPAQDVAQNLIGSQAAANLVRPSAADESVLYSWILCLGADGGNPYAGNYAGATYGPAPAGGSSGSSSGSGSSGGSG